jgi:hypothetical protein
MSWNLPDIQIHHAQIIILARRDMPLIEHPLFDVLMNFFRKYTSFHQMVVESISLLPFIYGMPIPFGIEEDIHTLFKILHDGLLPKRL